MRERKEYWAKVVNEEALSFLCSIGVCTRELPIMKVYDISYYKVMVVEILRGDFPQQIEFCFSKGDISPLSYEDAVLLNMEHNAKWAEICNDCAAREAISMCEKFTEGIMSREEVKRLIMGRGVGSKKDNTSYQRIKARQANARQELSDEKISHFPYIPFHNSAVDEYCQDLFRRMSLSARRSVRVVNSRILSTENPKPENYFMWKDSFLGDLNKSRDLRDCPSTNDKDSRQKLPDEIDLYNFFEKWGGFAIGRYLSCSDKYVVGRDITLIGDMRSYMKEHDDFDYIIYKIGLQFYHAIKFKDRGTFLVSERRYKELKSKKGKEL